MVREIINLLLLILFVLFSGCSNKNSIFEKNVEKELATLTFTGTTGYIGSVLAGGTLYQTLTLKAQGGDGVKNISASISGTDPITFKGGVFPGTGGTCATTLGASQTCTVVLAYSPTNTADHKVDIIFNYNNTAQDKTYTYTVTADSFPDLKFEFGLTYDFGNKFVGTSTDLRIRINNHGSSLTTNISVNNLSLPYSFKGGTYPGTGGDCGTELASGSTCDIVINYSPSTNVKHEQDVTLTYNKGAGIESSTLSMKAWGFNEATLTFTATDGLDWSTKANNLDFTKTFTVTHSSGDVKANSLAITGLSTPFKYYGGSFPGTGGTCTTSLDRNSSCTIVLDLNSSSSGTFSDTINFSYHSGLQTKTIAKTLTAITKTKATVTYSDTGTLDFGTVRRNSTASSKTITLTYASGEVPATLTFPSLSYPFSYDASSTCGASLSSGTCTKIIKFLPTGNYKIPSPTTSTSFSYTDSISGGGGSNTLSLKGSSEVVFSTSSTSFGSVVSGATTDKTIYLYNYSGANATSISLASIDSPFAFKGGSYPGTGGSCGSSMNAAAQGTSYSSCTIVLSFSPSADQAYTGNLVLNLNDGVGATTQSISLSGTGAPAAVLTMESKDYGTTGLNSQVAPVSMIKVTNTSTVTATSLSIPSLPSGFSFKGTGSSAGSSPGASGTCSSTLSSGQSCYYNIYFTPTTIGTYSSTLTLNYNNGATSTSVTSTLSGVAENNTDLYLANYGNTLAFGTLAVGATSDLTIKLGQGGSSTATTSIAVSTTSSDFIVQNNPCATSMSNGQTCTLTIRFAPQSGGGSKSGSLQVTYVGSGGSTTITRALTGTGYTPALLSLSPSSYDFGAKDINSTYDTTIVLTKSGEYSLSSSSVTKTITASSGFTFKGGAFPGTGGTCSTTATLSGSCNIVVTYSPTSITNYTAQMKLTYNNGVSSTNATTDFTGSGKRSLSFSSSSFGQVIQTLSLDKTITVTNNDSNNATAISSSTLSSPFAFKGGSYPGTGGTCGISLNASASCTLVVTFTPTTVGSSSGTLTLTYNDGRVSNATASASLTGEGISQAILVMSESNTYDFGTASLNSIISKLFTVTNSGGYAATTLAGNFSSTVFSFLGGTFPGTGGTCTASGLAVGASCSIVLAFKPTAASTYNELFNLTYNDGIRAQTEPKNLKGTGSNSINKSYYLSLIEQKNFSASDLDGFSSENIYLGNIPADVVGFSELSLPDINRNGANDRLISIMRLQSKSYVSYVGLDGITNRQLYRVYNFLPGNYLQGVSAVTLDEDINHDGVDEVLLGIYKKQEDHFTLVGFDIICGKTGKILKHYLPAE